MHPMVSIVIHLYGLYTPHISQPAQDIRVIMEAACLNIVKFNLSGLTDFLSRSYTALVQRL